MTAAPATASSTHGSDTSLGQSHAGFEADGAVADGSQQEAMLRRLLDQVPPESPLARLRQQLPQLDAATRERLLERLLALAKPAKTRAQRIESGESNRTRKLLERLAGLDDAEVRRSLQSVLERDPSPRLQALRDRLDTLPADSQRTLLERLLRLHAERTVEAPLSYGQERTWLMEQMNPGTGVLNIAAGVLAEGPLDLGLLERAMNRIVERHEVLRTQFRTRKGQPLQVVSPVRRLEIREIDLRGVPAADLGRAEDDAVHAEARQPFNLSDDLLVRLTSIRSGDERRLLLLVVHHIVADEWSIGVLIHEIGSLYRSLVLDEPVDLPELPIQYADYAQWQRRHLPLSALSGQLDFWRRQLAGIPSHLEVPTDRPRPARQSLQGGLEISSFPVSTSNAFRRLARQEGVTLFMALLAAFDVLIHAETGQTDLVVGTDYANRERGETEHLIGFFVNQLALRTRLDGDPTFRELLERVRGTTLDAFRHQDVPFQYVLESLALPRDPSRSPLFQVVFDLHNVPMGSLEFKGVRLSPLRLGQRPAKFDLTLFVNDADEALLAVLEYNSDLYEKATATSLVERYGELLQACAARPDARLSELAALVTRRSPLA